MKTDLAEGETVVKEGRANLQRGAETVGGHVYLTDRRLIFESHRLNFQSGSTAIDLRDVTGVSKTWTKFLNVVPLAPNSISISTTDGSEHRLVCFGRSAWIAAIHQQRH